MVEVSNANRVVFPAIGCTKGDVVAYYERIAPRMLPHVRARPLSIRRFPKGVAAPGFFQKNVPSHYPSAIGRAAVPRSSDATRAHEAGRDKRADFTVYPLVDAAEHLAYLANQGAIELHVTQTRAPDLHHPNRLVIDLDPPAGEVALARRAAHLTRAALASYGLSSVPVATGSKGYHVVVAVSPTVEAEVLAHAARQFATLLAAGHPDALTTVFRIALRGRRVFADWLRNNPMATVIAPYGLRATERATVATPLGWDELDETAPDAFHIGDLARLCERPDPLAALDDHPCDPQSFVEAVDAAFTRSGLVLEPFDRFRS
jgi:bifunctional non-homologous end joining protein LigD